MAKTVVGNLVVQLIANTKAFKKGMDDARNNTKKWGREAAAIVRKTRTPFEMFQQRLGRLSAMLRTGAIDNNTYVRAVKQARAALLATVPPLAKVATGVKATSGAMLALAASAKAAAASMLTMFGPLAALFGVFRLGRVTEEFEQNFKSALAIMQDVTGEMRATMRETAKEVAFNTKFAAEDTAKAFFFLASAGLDAAQSIKALPAVAQFAQAGMFDLSRATELLAGSQAAMGLQSKNAQENLTNMIRVSDVLVGANILAQATTEEFAEALGNKAAAAAKFMGVSLEETVAVLAVLAKQNVKGAEAGTRFTIALRELERRARENEAAFKKFNVTVLDAEKNFLGFKVAVGSLENALRGLEPGKKADILAQLGFTAKSIANIKLLLGQSELIGEFTERLRAMGGITKDVAANQIPAFTKAMKQALDTIKEIAAASLGPIMRTIAEAVSGLVAGFRSLNKLLGGGLIIWIKWTVTIGAIMLAMKAYASVLLALKAALVATTVAQAILTALSGPAGWIAIAGALAVAVTVVELLEDSYNNAADAANGLADAQKKVGLSAEDMLERQRDVTFQIEQAQLNLARATARAEDRSVAANQFRKQAIKDVKTFKAELAALSKQWFDLENSIEAATEASAKFTAEAVEKRQALGVKTVASLREQLALFGATTEELRMHKIALLDISDEHRQRAFQLSRELGLMEDQKKAARELVQEQKKLAQEQKRTANRLTQDAKRVFDATRTPAERFRKTLEDLQRLADVGALGRGPAAEETLRRAVQKARAEMRAAFSQVDKVPTPQLAAAIEMGSAEAFSAIHGIPGRQNKQLDILKQSEAELERIRKSNEEIRDALARPIPTVKIPA